MAAIREPDRLFQRTQKTNVKMKTGTLCIFFSCLFYCGQASAQWVVTDPGNLAQSIINMSDNIAHTSKTAVSTAENFAETVKIYEQAKRYYDGAPV